MQIDEGTEIENTQQSVIGHFYVIRTDVLFFLFIYLSHSKFVMLHIVGTRKKPLRGQNDMI